MCHCPACKGFTFADTEHGQFSTADEYTQCFFDVRGFDRAQEE